MSKEKICGCGCGKTESVVIKEMMDDGFTKELAQQLFDDTWDGDYSA